jgi:PHD/YefM family antitoxin component YafN of YafNO toxin-antitoxin module
MVNNSGNLNKRCPEKSLKQFRRVDIMPTIRNSVDLVNNFTEIRDFCQNYREPIFLTNNGRGELAVMSIDAYEELVGRIGLYHALQQGLDQINNGSLIEEEEMIGMLNNYIGSGR